MDRSSSVAEADWEDQRSDLDGAGGDLNDSPGASDGEPYAPLGIDDLRDLLEDMVFFSSEARNAGILNSSNASRPPPPFPYDSEYKNLEISLVQTVGQIVNLSRSSLRYLTVQL